MTLIIGEQHRNFAITFGAMAFSTFVFDTLDVSTRLGRYIIQELLGLTSRVGALLATLATVALPVVFLSIATPGSWVKFWTLFGASNQLLAALTLLSISVWLHKRRQKLAFTLLPMAFVLVVTLYALTKLTLDNLQSFSAGGGLIELANAVVSVLLIGLALFLVGSAIVAVRRPRPSIAPAGA